MKQSTLLLIALTLIVIWGTAYTMVSVGVQYISPIWLVAYRTILGAILVTLYAYWRGHKFPRVTDPRWVWYFGLGLIGMVIPFFMLSVGQLTIDSGIAAIIVGAMPLMTIIMAHFFANERLTLRKILGFMIGFSGIVILFLPENFNLTLIKDWRAQLLIVGGAFFYAVTTILAKRAPDTPSSLAAAMMLVGAAIASTVAGILSGIPETIPAAMGIWMAIGLGVGSTALGNILFLYVIQKEGPSMLARINYFPPLASVIAGVWLLNEPFTWRIAVAMAVILFGVFISRSGATKPVPGTV